jgi:Putative Flp pilus-assembly TadE/G-like
MRRDARGQILPLFALMLVGIFAMAALAIDVSSAYSARQFYRTAADAAALAGAQDLQVTNSRAVTPLQYTAARSDAKASIEAQFGAAATCALSGNRSDCTFTNLPYQFAIVTPLPIGACVSCDLARSVQVNFVHPTFQLTFAHVLGFANFRVGVSSVAGLQFNHSYAIVTLRPPSSAVISGVRDMKVGSNVQVVVRTGDVGTNANMTYGGSSALLSLDSGYTMEYFDPNNPPLWGLNPPGTLMAGLILDPGYPVPSTVGAPVGSVDGAGCAAIALYVQSNPNYAPFVPMAGALPDMTKITCYRNGVYSTGVKVNNGSLGIFEPGLYFFDGGLDAQGTVIGGYTPGSEGVAFVFPESPTMFNNLTNGKIPGIVALNAGTRYLNPGGSEATAARDYSGGLVQTNTSPKKLMMTVIVPPDSNCPVSFTTFVTCTNNEENKNSSIKLTGNSGVYLAGVQYAPSDNVSVSGNTATGGYVGQVWAWTLTYTGNSIINQEGDQNTGPGTLRLDAACTAPGTPCIP